MSKIKVPKPVKDHVVGEEPTHEPTIVHPPSVSEVRRRTVTEASALVGAMLRAGIGDRAVVVPKEIEGEAMFNPNHWGIICRVEPFNNHPLYVKFVTGQIAWMKMEHVSVIWPTITIEELKHYISDRKQ